MFSYISCVLFLILYIKLLLLLLGYFVVTFFCFYFFSSSLFIWKFSFLFCFLLWLFGWFCLPVILLHLLLTFYTGHVITSYSNINETATKTKYNKNIVKPKPLFMRQRKQAIDITTNSNIINNIVMEHTMPTEFTSTGAS